MPSHIVDTFGWPPLAMRAAERMDHGIRLAGTKARARAPRCRAGASGLRRGQRWRDRRRIDTKSTQGAEPFVRSPRPRAAYVIEMRQARGEHVSSNADANRNVRVRHHARELVTEDEQRDVEASLRQER